MKKTKELGIKEIKVTKAEMELLLCMFMDYNFSQEIDEKLDEISILNPSNLQDEFIFTIKGDEITQVLSTLNEIIEDSCDFENEVLKFMEEFKQKIGENSKGELTLTAKEMTMLLKISVYYELSYNIDDQLEKIGEKFPAGITKESEDFILRINDDEPQEVIDSLDGIIIEGKIKEFAIKLKAEIEESD
jgi:hypothetical protein